MLGQATLNVKQKFPQIEAIGHFHDGNVIVVPKAQEVEVIDYFNKQVKVLGQEAGLSYPQSVEVKEVYR